MEMDSLINLKFSLCTKYTALVLSLLKQVELDS